ncbi:tail fiber domain-containing protein [Stenotrophomonas sp. WZN-1]|uniref:tail fiber domain-containing protein n=1 Tax=Stenotrophomonas sp. WZN-1 TaxID=2005046 RepID=UPI0012FDB966|nr:tail fiber domain-containing protein [Stenotrophomonas sp. WZN-1]
MADLAQLASANFPTGTESIGNNLDNYLRAIQSILRSTNAVASATIAAASTTDISLADGESVQVTGSATINSFGTGYVGCRRELRFNGACTLVNGSNIQLGGANLVTVSGDCLTFRCTASGVWTIASVGGSLRRTGDRMYGALQVGTAGNPFFSISNSGANDIYLTGNSSTGALPNANLYYRGGSHTWTEGAGVTIGQMSGAGRLQLNHTGNDYLVSVRGSYTFSWFNFGNGQTGLFDNTAGANALLYNTAGSGAWALRGDVTASGNVTGGSDERVKENWRPLSSDLVEQLAGLEKVGTYDRTDIGTTQTGVGAQSLRKVLPHTVHEDGEGLLSVAYGNAALVGVVATARRLLALEARVAELGGG